MLFISYCAKYELEFDIQRTVHRGIFL